MSNSPKVDHKDPNMEVVIKITPITPKDIEKYTKNRRYTPSKALSNKRFIKIDPEPHTPKASVELAMELKKVINERNILTSKTRKRVFECLDELKSNTETERKNFKREQALLEIVNSETKYIKQLETIMNFFMAPVQEKKLLKPDDYTVLFGNIGTIYNINRELLDELDKGFDNVANAFSKIAPFLKLYSVYAYEFKKSIKLLQNSRSCNLAFATFVESQETRPEVQNKLSALLITPIQRVPRYKLLLNQLYEFSSPSDKDFNRLKDCIKKIDEAAAHINKILEEQENAQRLLEVQRFLRGGELNLMAPGRKLKKEGMLHKMSTKKNGYSEKLYVVLMSDIIMLNKLKKGHLSIGSLKVQRIYPLNKCVIDEILDKGCMKITCQDEEMILYSDKLEDTISWINAIKDTIDKYLEDRKSLRKESSSRRAVKRKDIGEYHEVGLSPGLPLKKRKTAINGDESSILPATFRPRIAARKSVRSACNSTPIKLEANPENRGFTVMNTSYFSSSTSDDWKSDTVSESTLKPVEDNTARDEVFVFGQKHEEDAHNASKISTFFRSFGATVKGFLGFKSNKQ